MLQLRELTTSGSEILSWQKKLQEYVRLDRFIKQENVILKAQVDSLQTLVDEVTGSNRSLRKQLKQKDKQFEKLISVQQQPAPSPPQVQVLFNTSASVSGVGSKDWSSTLSFQFCLSETFLHRDMQDLQSGGDVGLLFWLFGIIFSSFKSHEIK